MQPGTIVKLKSGGPEMTIQSNQDLNPGWWRCVWFDENVRKTENFQEIDRAISDLEDE